MNPEQENSGIDRLNESLYSRNGPQKPDRRRMRYENNSDDSVPGNWGSQSSQSSVLPPKKPRMAFLTKLLIASILFCIIAVSVGAYIFFNGSNLISANNIDVAINGPVSIPGGTPISFDIAITNNNSINLENVSMMVDFPPGANSPASPATPLNTYRESLGGIATGATVRRSIQAVIFGEQNTQKTITIDVTYNVKGSTSTFTKEKTYDILINSSPVNLSVSSFKEITAGQEFTLTVDVKSNSANALKNVLVKAAYPPGFSFTSSSPAPLSDKASWRLGDLPAGGERSISIKGKLQGENEDSRVFRFSVGSQSPQNANAIGTEYMQASQEISLKKSFMTVNLTVNGNQSSSDTAVSFNQPVTVEISWYNNLVTAITNAEIKVKLSGSAYDRAFVQPRDGYFRSSTDEIIWNAQTLGKLLSVPSGDGGTVSFNITPRDLGTSNRPLVNPTLNFSVSVSGKRAQETGVPEELSSIVTKSARVSTSANLSGRVVRYAGPFAVSGPIPPKADKETTYTVVWNIDSTVNAINNAEVSASLPVNVKWLGKTDPEGADISYDTKTGSILWRAGEVSANTASSGGRKTVSFQVSLEPSINQVGSVPVLVNEAVLLATDEYTGTKIRSSQGSLTTRFSTDPSYRSGDEVVVQ